MRPEEVEAWLKTLDQDQIDAIADLIDNSSYALWAPNPGPQMEAFLSPADELFFGGAAGGGKTSLLVGLSLIAHQRSLILRRESTQLRGFIDDLARILKTRDGLNKQDGQWRVPPALAHQPDQLIEFGGVPNPGDEERHQGIPHDLLGFDEVTQFSQYVVDYLSTWNRTVLPGQRTRMVLTSNPPTPSTSVKTVSADGGQWLLRRYAPWLDPTYAGDPAKPGELRWYVTLDGLEREHPDGEPFEHVIAHGPKQGEVEIIQPKSRTFIPSLPTDNPYTSSAYIATLQKLPEPLRSALLYGDFSVSLSDRPMQLIPTEWLRAAQARHRAQNGPPPSVEQTALGVDVARGGADASVVVERYRHYYADPQEIPKNIARTGPEVALEALKHRRNESTVVIDANGPGASVYDHMTEALGLDDIIGWVGSKRSNRRDKSGKFGFTNMRTEIYWRLREALDPASNSRIALPDDPDLTQELLAMTYKEVSGKYQLITKEDLISVLGRSPDKADALSLAHSVYDESSDEAARAQELRRNRLRGAGLDIYDENGGTVPPGVYRW